MSVRLLVYSHTHEKTNDLITKDINKLIITSAAVYLKLYVKKELDKAKTTNSSL